MAGPAAEVRTVVTKWFIDDSYICPNLYPSKSIGSTIQNIVSEQTARPVLLFDFMNCGFGKINANANILTNLQIRMPSDLEIFFEKHLLEKISIGISVQ